MAAKCFPLVGGRVMRVTRLDGCGRPDRTDPDFGQVVTDGFVSAEVTANIAEGEAISVTNAAGKQCVNQQAKPSLTGYGVNLTFCNVDPDLFALVTGQEPVLDPRNGDGIGFRVNTGRGADVGFALEIWSSVPGVTCPVDANGDPIPGADEASGYILFPFLQGGVFGDFTIENDAVSFVVQGAQSYDGSGWGLGPYDVTLDENGDPGPLTEVIDPKDHLHVQITYVAPPEPSCGAIGIPAATPAPPIEGVTAAGAPNGATLQPAGAKKPADLAALKAHAVIGDTGTNAPVAAWTVGQFIILADYSEAHWDGDEWVVGRAV